ncbi:hypothetical protein NDU88_001646 [Pleurodeles waltl]|uniref:Uncharacterized protein n=1 Tax=Pleurodeles waltl TaxID=8319 RepID=A0AAV7MM50_PLEWA|nr:hypothetical protein NDU88_001646 [Pleurodeles waltl]
MIDYYVICGYDPQSLSVEELQGRNEFLQYLLAAASKNVRNRGSAFATSAQDTHTQEKLVNSLPHASASQIHFQHSAKTKNPDTVQEATLGIPLFSVECFSPSRPVSQNSKCSADSYKDLSVPQSFQVSRLDPVSNGSVKTVGFLSSTHKACALPKLDDNTPVSIPKSSAKPFSILSGFDNNMDIHTLKEQFWQIKRQILDFYDEYVITYTRNLARGLFSSMHISLLPEPDILFICKVEEVTEQLMETTAKQFENLKKENDHQLWLKEQYATLCASPKTSIEQIVPSINDSQKTAPVINISASSSDSLSACSSPVKIPVQLIESLRDLTPLDSKDGSESSEGSVSAPLSEQIKPKEEESSDADSNSCTLRNQDMTLLEINGKLCTSVEKSESSDDSGSCLAVNKPANSAVQMAHTPEFSDCGDTPALSNNIIEFLDNKETVPVSSELMDFSDHEEIPAITKNVMDFSESLKISSVSKQTVENSDKEESQQSETKQPVIRNESLLLELDTVAASTIDSDLLFLATALPVSSSTVSEEQISDLPVSDFDVKSATPTPPAVSLKLKTPENQQSETEAQVLKDVIFPTKTKDLNLNLVLEDLMISTVLSVLLQETIINSKARAEKLGNSVKVISEETPVLFLSKEQPFNVNRVEDELPVVETPCKETISDTTNTPQSTCNEEISVLSEDHPKELVCGTSTFSYVNPVSKDMKTLVAPEFDTPKSSKMKENSDLFMVTLRTPVTHVSQVSMLCKPQTTINVNTAAETDKSCLSEGVTDLTVTNTPIISSKEDSTEQGTNVLKNTAHDAIPDLLAPESTSPETNSMHSSRITRTIKRKDIGAHMGINTCFAHWMIHLWQDCKLINQDYYVICGYDPQSLSVEELQGRNEFLQYLLAEASKNVRNRGSAFATSAQDTHTQEKLVNSLPHASASQIHFQHSAKTKNPDTVQEATLGIPLFSVECFSPSRPVSQNSKCSADSYKDLSVPQSFQVSRLDPVSNGSVKTVGFLSSTHKACALPKLDDNTPVSIPKSSAKPFSILSGFDNNMDIHTLKEQFWQIKRQILDFYDEYVITYTRNLARGLFSSMHISLLPEPDILFICKVEEVTEQLMETTAKQFENLKKENDHQLWLKEQYATLCASPKTSIEQIVPSINDSQKTAPVINISASSSDSLSACSSPVKIPVQLIESLRDLTPLDSKDGSESSEGSVSAPLSEQIKPKEEESSDADSNSCTLRNQDMTLLEINGKLCTSVEESESSDDSGSCLAVNKPANSAVQMAHTPEFSDCGDTPALSNNIIEFLDNKETVPVSSELMDFSDHEEIPAITKNVMDFSESLKISSVSKQTVENSDKEESQQSETKQPVIRNESLLLELDTVAASTIDSDLLFLATALPVSSSTVSEEQISDLPVSDFDVKSATPTPPAVSLKLKTPENQQSETEAQVLKDVIFPTKTKDLNLNLVLEDLMISTVLSVLLQETIINSKARAEKLGNSVKVISEETPVLFLSKEQPFNVNRVEDELPVVETPCKETISDTTNTPQSTCNEEISVLSEDHPKELVCGTSTFSYVNPVSKDMKTLVAPEFDTPKSSKMKENSDLFMVTLRTPVTHVSQVSMLCKPQTTINVNTAAETDKSCLSEGVTDLTVTNTPIISSKEDSTEQGTNVLKNTAHDAIPDLLAPESTSPETNSMHSSRITRTIKRKDIGAHMGINTCFAHWMIHL